MTPVTGRKRMVKERSSPGRPLLVASLACAVVAAVFAVAGGRAVVGRDWEGLEAILLPLVAGSAALGTVVMAALAVLLVVRPASARRRVPVVVIPIAVVTGFLALDALGREAPMADTVLPVAGFVAASVAVSSAFRAGAAEGG
jgi:hypothetical protein